MKRLTRSLWLLALIAGAPMAHAIQSPSEMLANPAQEARAEVIGRQLRCLVCQNEDIEDSGADLAQDLRAIVRQQVAAGRTNRQVVAWMVSRYGEFVRLSPPFDAATLLLWTSPVLALGAGLVAMLVARRRRPAPLDPLTAEERRQFTSLTGREA